MQTHLYSPLKNSKPDQAMFHYYQDLQIQLQVHLQPEISFNSYIQTFFLKL